MSITLDSSNTETLMAEIEPSPPPSGLRRAECGGGGGGQAGGGIFESPDERGGEEERNECSSSSGPAESSTTTTSSIGKNSDASGQGSGGEEEEEEEEEDENEVQSEYKGTLDSMEALEEVLPIRRGISKFYNGKSKSFTSLSAASCSSMKDIAKPENAYTRRRRNLLAFNLAWDKNRSSPYRSNGGGISKRPISSSKSTLALAVAMSSSESISSTSDDSYSSSISKSPPHLPPLHPRTRASQTNLNHLASSPSPSPRQRFSPWRSYSLADLQHCGTGAAAGMDCSQMYDKTDH